MDIPQLLAAGGFIITIFSLLAAVIRWAVNLIKEQLNHTLDRFEHNTDRIMDEFSKLTESVNIQFRKSFEERVILKTNMLSLEQRLTERIQDEKSLRDDWKKLIEDLEKKVG